MGAPMRIDSTTSPTPAPLPSDGATGVTSAGSAERTAGKAGEAPRPAPESRFAPTVDLARLLEAVRQTPDIRTDVVDAVKARIASGELATPAAAQETAAALYNSLDG